MNRFLLTFLLITCSRSITMAQQVYDFKSAFALPDTARAFTIENFYFLILRNHPIAKQIDLLSEVAKQEVRMARGSFDPKLELSYLNKNYQGTEYYEMMDAGIKFPTLVPINPSVGFERNEGAFLNPENYISSQYDYTQLYAGVSIPLGRGLITDDRRVALKQAELFQRMTEAEQVKLLNKLLLDAAKDYWQWYYGYYHFRLLNRGVVLASDIFERSKLNTELGEMAPLDTVQAQITLQQRLIEQRESLLEFQNAGVQLSNYLWDSIGNPLSLELFWAPILQPEPWFMSREGLTELKEQARLNHPELRKLSVKLLEYDLDRRLAKEYLKPKLNLDYYFLNQPVNPEGGTSFGVGEDYKLGIDFSIPIFLRKERSKLSQVNLKITSTQFERSVVERRIENEINATYNQLMATTALMTQQNQMVSNYQRLLQGELLNLENGESDLFKINIQQEKLIQSQIKLLKLQSDFEKQKATLQWAAGVRNLGSSLN